MIPRPADYGETLRLLKAKIQAARVRAGVAVNRELIGLYWNIGQTIVEGQRLEGWVKSVADAWSADSRTLVRI
jgi:hypothetical protein